MNRTVIGILLVLSLLWSFYFNITKQAETDRLLSRVESLQAESEESYYRGLFEGCVTIQLHISMSVLDGYTEEYRIEAERLCNSLVEFGKEKDIFHGGNEGISG